MAEEKKLVWNNCVKIGEALKSARTKVVVELVARDGVKYLNIRGWYIRQRDQEWMPAMDGIAIPISVPIEGDIVSPIADIMDLIHEALDRVADFPIEDEANAVYTIKKPRGGK